MTQPQLVLAAGGIQLPSGDVLNTTLQLGMQNRLHNALFNINQRAVSGTVTLAAGAYGHDRWKAGAGGCTYTFATVGNITTLTITAGTLQQVIEGANLESGTHCLSWVGTAQARIDSGSYSTSGMTGTSVGGTNQTIEFSTGTVSLPQYEAGGNASAFGYRPIGLERLICQSYCNVIPCATAGLICTLVNNATTQALGNYKFPVTMRATPTFSVIGTNAITYTGQTGSGTATLAVVSGNDPLNQAVFSVVGSGFTAGQAAYCSPNAGMTAIVFSADL